jgi:amidase
LRDKWNAFINDELSIRGTESGQLKGLSFAVKDVFDIKDYKSSAGNPDWLNTHQKAEQNAPIIDTLLKQGAFLKGTTHTDELMYSLNGENFHYGTPINPKSSDHIPGGSSSGSAVAVAAGLVDFALGTDTGGSIRVPSSYCGIYGFRPSHGLVSSDGVIPLAKGFDTVGWMTRDAELLLKVGEVVLKKEMPDINEFSIMYVDEEVWSYVDNDTKEVYSQALNILKDCYCTQHVKVSNEGLKKWAELFRYKQGIEIWEEHGSWIKKVKPTFGPGISERFQWASTLENEKLNELEQKQTHIKKQLSDLLKENGLLVIPTTPGEAPLKNLSLEAMENYRSKTMQLTCIAGLSGFPQVTVPMAKKNGIPIGLSFIANQYQDLKLLKWVINLFDK